jgi:hypothetical protein
MDEEYEPMAMDSAPENALPWAQELLPKCDWCLIIAGQREDSGKMNWERWASGLTPIELMGILEDVKFKEWMDCYSREDDS